MITVLRLKTADDILDALSEIDTQAIRLELKKLRGIRQWAMENLGVDYEVGDKVVLTRNLGGTKLSHGWYIYREALEAGAEATVTRIDFSPGLNGDCGDWIVEIQLDREWSVHDDRHTPKGPPRRYWNGLAEETPEGMEAASSLQGDRRHVFMVRTGDVRKAPPTDPEACETCGRRPCP